MALPRPAAPAAQQPLSRVACSQVQVTAGLERRQVGALGRARSPASDGSRGQHVINLQVTYSKTVVGCWKRETKRIYHQAAGTATHHCTVSQQVAGGNASYTYRRYSSPANCVPPDCGDGVCFDCTAAEDSSLLPFLPKQHIHHPHSDRVLSCLVTVHHHGVL